MSDTKHLEFGLAILARRAERHIGVRDAAAEMGVSPATVSRLERGQIDSPVLKALSWLASDNPEADGLRARAEKAEREAASLRALLELVPKMIEEAKEPVLQSGNVASSAQNKRLQEGGPNGL